MPTTGDRLDVLVFSVTRCFHKTQTNINNYSMHTSDNHICMHNSRYKLQLTNHEYNHSNADWQMQYRIELKHSSCTRSEKTCH